LKKYDYNHLEFIKVNERYIGQRTSCPGEFTEAVLKIKVQRINGNNSMIEALAL
jgi:hypothetical protein